MDFSRKGVVPVQLGDIPTSILSFIESAFVTTEIIVEAAMEKSRKKFVEAIILDGCVSSVAEAYKLADELIAAHKENLPGW